MRGQTGFLIVQGIVQYLMGNADAEAAVVNLFVAIHQKDGMIAFEIEVGGGRMV